MIQIAEQPKTFSFDGTAYVRLEDYVAALPSDEWLKVDKNASALEIAKALIARYDEDTLLKVAGHLSIECEETW